MSEELKVSTSKQPELPFFKETKIERGSPFVVICYRGTWQVSSTLAFSK